MKRDTAFSLLVAEECSTSVAIIQVAQALGCTRQAVQKWPHDGHLPRPIADKVLAALARKRLSQRIAQRVAAGKRISPVELDVIALPE